MLDSDLIGERQRFLELLLRSRDPRKLIMAGPGTGKTYSFKRLLELREDPKLVLTFINNLVEDLARDLGELAEVQTLHGFCRGQLHRIGPGGVSRAVDYYPAFSHLLAADATILLGVNVGYRDIEAVLHTMREGEILDAVLRSGDYYDAVGHSDSVYRMVKHFEDHAADIPTYTEVVVDEFQDFSAMEVRFIELLTMRSSILIVGDDDQALYSFKQASPEYLRRLAVSPDYVRFDLPFSSRCTEVLVNAVRRVVEEAQARGLLQGRLEKPFLCFTPTKRTDSDRYPRIIHARCSVERNNAPYMGRYVYENILRVDTGDVQESEAGRYPTVLVTGPVQFSRRVYEYLVDRMPNVEYKRSPELHVALLDGYIRLARDPQSRLGWRIICYRDHPEGLSAILRRAIEGQEELADLLPEDFKLEHLRNLEIIERLRAEEEIGEDDVILIENMLEMELGQIRRHLGLEPQPEEDREEPEELTPAQRADPTVAVTSLVGAKGLQASHVFVVGVNEGHFPRDNGTLTDDEVCSLIVALTRATKSCHIVSCGRFGNQRLRESAFVDWLQNYISPVTVDANYFRTLS